MKELLSVFQSGQLVSTKYGNDDKWVSNSIGDIDIENYVVSLTVKKEYIDNELSVNQEIEIKTVANGNVYSAKGKIMKIEDCTEHILRVKIYSLELIDTSSDKRDNTRYFVNFDCIIKSVYITNSESLKVVNLSGTGVRITGSHQNIPIGENVFVDIFLDNGNMLKTSGKIVRKKINGYDIEYGVNCTPIDETNENQLTELLHRLYLRDNQESNQISVIKKLREKSLSSIE